MTAKLTTPKYLIAIDMVDDKLELARKYGATHTINGSKEDVGERLQEITGGLGVQFALDAVGSPAVLKLAQTSLAIKGMMVTIGGTPYDVVLSTLPHIQKGLTYRGCHMGDATPALVRPCGLVVLANTVPLVLTFVFFFSLSRSYWSCGRKVREVLDVVSDGPKSYSPRNNSQGFTHSMISSHSTNLRILHKPYRTYKTARSSSLY